VRNPLPAQNAVKHRKLRSAPYALFHLNQNPPTHTPKPNAQKLPFLNPHKNGKFFAQINGRAALLIGLERGTT